MTQKMGDQLVKGDSAPTTPVVLLSGRGPQHDFVARTLFDAFGGRLAAIVVTDPEPEPTLARLRRVSSRYSGRELLSRVGARAWRMLHRLDARQHERIVEILFPDGEPDPLPQELFRTVPNHNHEDCRALLRELNPRVLAIFGTDIIRAPVIELAGDVALNLHTGISPRYRGADSPFWALYNEEPEWVGATVHVLDSGIDSGAILGTVRPEIASDDDEASLFAKCVRVGAHLYADEIRRILAGKIEVKPQDLESGKQYRFVDRTVSAEKRVRRLVADGLLRRYVAGE